MKRYFRKFAAFIAALFKAFFDIREDDQLAAGTVKISATVARRVLYVLADYWTALVLASIVSGMKYLGYDFLEIFIMAWVYDFLVAETFLVVSLKSGQDITLGESFRRAAEVIHANSRIIGYLTFLFINVKAVIWDGPELIAVFFKEEIGSLARMSLILIGLTFIQGLFWAWVYSLGYESVSELAKMFF